MLNTSKLSLRIQYRQKNRKDTNTNNRKATFSLPQLYLSKIIIIFEGANRDFFFVMLWVGCDKIQSIQGKIVKLTFLIEVISLILILCRAAQEADQ